MTSHDKSKRTRSLCRRAVAGWVLTGLLFVVLIVGYGVNSFLSPLRDESPESLQKSEDRSNQEGDGNEDPWLQVPDLSNAPVYKTGEAVELTGTERTDGSDAGIAEEYGWVGTMRFTVFDPVIYSSPSEAGIDYEEGRFDEYQVITVDVTVENIDAHCQPDYEDDLGSEAILLTLFRLLAGPADEHGNLYYTIFAGCSAPRVDGLKFYGHQASCYTWVEPGSSAKVRLGFYVIGSRQVSTSVSGPAYEEHDAASADLDYMLQFSFGHYDGVPIIQLGSASLASKGA